MLKTTMGQVLVNSALPPGLRDYSRRLDGKAVAELMERVAREHPDKYREVVKALSDVGRESAYATGGFTFGLKDLKPAQAYRAARQEIEADVARVVGDRTLSDAQRQEQILAAVGRHQAPLQAAIYREALAANNPLAVQVVSGSRGKPMNLKSLLGADLLYTDHRDRAIPIPVLRGYGQGLTPAEYFAGAFGARKGTIDTKFATQRAGFFSKQLKQAAHRLVVTRLDADGDGVPDAPARGLPVDTADPDNEGALLAHPAGGYPRNTVLTPRVLGDLRARGVGRILARSPLVGGPPDGGLYGRDVGVRERGGVAPVGDMVGLAAAQALGEPISQGGLSSKHSGGVAGAGKTVGGFQALNQLVQVPEAYPGGAAHATKDGRVQSVVDAPAGGRYVVVGGENHYVAPGFELKVKPGDEVEAGDVLSEGLPNPAMVVRHKGVGEGRRYFVEAFRAAMRDAGLGSDRGTRRNLEVVARGLIDHVRLTEEVGDHVPGDVVRYSQLESAWEPRPGARRLRGPAALGKYLERPVLHHTIGTRVTRKVLADMAEFGVEDVDAHDDPPPFEPEQVRGMDNLSHDPDWMTRMLGSNIQKNLLAGVHRGAVSDAEGTSYVPALADPVDFGRRGLVRGFDPKAVRPPAAPAGAGVL